ncbi:MAG: TIGR03668 family PPOX class F420-dependent oxidoreductase [Mycobacteriales bacterium]
MTTERALRLLSRGRVARLATVGPSGAPHVVPITYAVDGDVLFTAVDAKPKRSRALQRLRNIEYEPRVSVLLDQWDEDWSRLWWVRADGVAEVLAADPGGTDLLVAKYEQYRTVPPDGPLIRMTVQRLASWEAAGPAGEEQGSPSALRGAGA